MRRSGGDELVALGLLLRGRERVDGPRGALLAEDEAHLLRRAQPLRGVRTEGRARLIEAQGAEQIAMEETRLARHLAALRHLPRRPPSGWGSGMESPSGSFLTDGFRKWRGFRDQAVKSLQISHFLGSRPRRARILRGFSP